MPTHYLYKTASVQFIDTNIASNIKVDTANAASLVTRRLLRLTMLKHLTRILLQDTKTLRLYYIRFVITFNKLVLSMRILLGKYFFINRDFGPFTL